MMTKILGLLFLFISTLSISYGSDEELNACFITINSTEEKHLFKKQLSTGVNKDKFKFHEFIPSNPDNHNWFAEACEKKIRCDILVISGHFGGNFFGESGFSLGMNELEEQSCKNTCDGLLSSPKEVFLLGCNTLAGKEEDNRDAATYLNVLLDDDIPMEEASRIVEQRYGAVGTSFADSMKRAFKGVPHIYGFHSVGPSGSSIERLLNNYHEDVPDYSQHLLEIEVKRGLALMNDFSKWNQKNDELAKALRITYFAQTSGVLIPCSGITDVSEDDPSYRVLNNICLLKTDDLSEDEALDHIKDLLLGDDFSLYLPVIAYYLDGKNISDKFKKILSEHPSIKDNIKQLLSESKTGFGKLQVARIAQEMGIISAEEFLDLEKKAVLSYLTPPVSVGSKDAVCSYDTDNKISFKNKDLDSKVYEDVNGLNAIMCLEIDDSEVVKKILDVAKKNSNKEVRKGAILALMNSKITDVEVLNHLNKLLASSDSPEDSALAFYSLSGMGQSSELMNKKLFEFLDSDRTVNAIGTRISEKKVAFWSMMNFKIKDTEQFKKIYNKIKSDKTLRQEGEDWIFAKMILNTPDNTQAELLTNFIEDVDVRISYYDWFHEGNEEDLKIDVKIMDTFLEDAKNHSDSLSLYYVSRFEVKTSEDELSVVNSLINAKLSKGQLNQAMMYLDGLNRKSGVLMKYIVDNYKTDKETFESSFYYYLLGIQNNKELSELERDALLSIKADANSNIQNTLDQLGI